MASIKKRSREAGEFPTPSTGPVLDAPTLLARIDAAPPSVQGAAARYGVAGADAYLCALGREIAGSLRDVHASAEEARAGLRSNRAALHAAVDARIAELEALLDSKESDKAAAIERELLRVDGALERTRQEHAAVRIAVESTPPGEFAALAARLDGVDALLAALPPGPTEPSLLQVEFDLGALLSRISGAGSVLAPRGVCAANVEVCGLPTAVHPDRPLQFELVIARNYEGRAPAELVAASTALATLASVQVALRRRAVAAAQTLPVSLSPDMLRPGRVRVIVAAVSDLGAQDTVEVSSVTLAGQRVGGQALPVRLHGVTAISAPLTLSGTVTAVYSTPAVSNSGQLFLPRPKSRVVHVFAANGSALPPLKVPEARSGYLHAAISEATSTLLLVERDGLVNDRVIAVDLVGRVVRWLSDVRCSIRGICVVAPDAFVVSCDTDDSELLAFRLSDGGLISSTRVKGASFLAADIATSTLFASVSRQIGPDKILDCGHTVSSYLWRGGALELAGSVEAAGVTKNLFWTRPLAVMPPAPGKSVSHLVVATCRADEVRVLALPACRLVHTFSLRGMGVAGVAAAPTGTALVVSDFQSKATSVLSWPLPGMPPLA